MRYTLKQANEDAARLGLYVTYYNAGGNPQWKVASADKPYHALGAGETLFRATSGSLVSAFLEGYFVASRAFRTLGFIPFLPTEAR